MICTNHCKRQSVERDVYRSMSNWSSSAATRFTSLGWAGLEMGVLGLPLSRHAGIPLGGVLLNGDFCRFIRNARS